MQIQKYIRNRQIFSEHVEAKKQANATISN